MHDGLRINYLPVQYSVLAVQTWNLLDFINSRKILVFRC